ncbi:MAG: tetratricopeptide repeat protein, partial [Alphaproteobacteria bacterium]
MTEDEKRAAAALRSGRLVDAERGAMAILSQRETAPALWILAGTRRLGGRPDEALDLYRRAVALDGDFLPALQDLGAAFMGAGDAESALATFRRAVAVAPDRTAAHSAMLVAMHYCGSVGAAEIAEAHRVAGRRYPTMPRPPRRPQEAGEPLRVGFVSADFRAHATAAFLPPLLRHRDPARWRAFLYSGVTVPDAATRRFRTMADGWVDAAFLDDTVLAARIAADGIDVLVDLNGHTAGGRLGLFARRPAPLQATWLDYVHSTGLPAIDVFITDADHLPASEDDRHVETPMRLAAGSFCFDPPADAPEPSPRDGPFVFGSCNALEKLSAETLATWARILEAVPETRLRIAAAALDRAHGRRRIREALAAGGVAPDRVELMGETDRAGMLARYGGIDLQLDSFPYSGGLTTLEALWMGVPTLTFPGDRIAGRHSASHLRRAGLGYLVATDRDDYMARAAAIARNPG